MIELIEFTRRYGNFTAVDGVSLKVSPGKICGLLGPNGAGKSTIVKAIVGAIRPTAGRILVNNLEISLKPEKVKSCIGYVPENPSVFKNLTGLEYLHFVGNLYHVPPRTLRQRIGELLEKFGLREQGGSQIFSYSKGMTRKLSLTAALLHNPEVLILDEPLSGLDANAAAVFKETIRSLALRGKTILFSSHILEVVEKLCDDIAILHEGAILARGTSPEILADTGTFSLEEVFIRFTGQKDVAGEAAGILAALD